MKTPSLQHLALVSVTITAIFVHSTTQASVNVTETPTPKDADEEGEPKCGKSLHLKLSGKVTTAFDSCSEKDITDFNCLAACFLQEMGLVKDGRWQDDVARENWEQIVDKSQSDYENLMNKFWVQLRQCVSKFEEEKKMFPTEFKGDNNTCSDIVSLVLCVNDVLTCPKL